MLIDSVLTQVVGKTINEIFLTDLLPDCEAKDFLKNSITLKEKHSSRKRSTTGVATTTINSTRKRPRNLTV